jgi:hypothetical protein
MTDDERKRRIAAWLETRPESVRKLAAEFPPEAVFDVNGTPMYVVSYTEGDELCVSPINPAEHAQAAFDARRMLCAGHLRDGSVRRIH